MSIKKINQWPEGSGSLTNDDVFLFMDNPSGGGITKKISLSEIANVVGDAITPADIGAVSLPASGLSITLGGEWWVGSPTPILSYVSPQAFGFGSTYTRYSGKWIAGFAYSEGGYTSGTRLTSITFSDLEGTTGNFSPTNCAALTTISTSTLSFVGGNFSPSTMSSLTSLSCPNLTYVVGNLAPSTMSSLTSVSCPNLVYIGGQLNPSGLGGSTSLSFPSLVYVGSSISVFAAGGAWSFPALVYAGGISLNTTTPATVSFPALSTINGAVSLTLVSATTFSLPALAYLFGGITVNAGASNLTTFTLPVNGTLKAVTGAVNFPSGITVPLSQASVDNILQALASLDGTNGTTSYTLAVTLASTSMSAPSNLGSTTTAGSNFVCSGTTCTVNWTGHGYATGDVLRISGITTATTANRYAVINVVNANQFTYTIAAQTATGAGTATVIKAAASVKKIVTRGVTLTTN